MTRYGKVRVAVARVEKAYNEATGNWSEADWTHTYEVDGVNQYEPEPEDDSNFNTPILCHGSRERCSFCAEVKESAKKSEDYAEKARGLAGVGDWDGASRAAEMASITEGQYGDAPTWGPFREAVEAAAALVAEVTKE